MARHIPEWTIRFGPDDQIINTAEGPNDEFQPPHAYVEWHTGVTVVTVSAFTKARAHQVATAALAEYTQERRDRLEASRRNVSA